MPIYLPQLSLTNWIFPPIQSALVEPNGLLAMGGDLHPQRLLQAYRQGIFPWYGEQDPLLWWSPDPRCVLFPAEIKISRSLNQTLRNKGFNITYDQAFDQVIAACSSPTPQRPSTWINQDMQQAYQQLFNTGHAHSVEVWKDQQLQGGLYGLQMGKLFFGESMFSRCRDASKVALVYLCQQAQAKGWLLIDCQVPNPHLLSLGAKLISRTEFQSYLERGLD